MTKKERVSLVHQTAMYSNDSFRVTKKERVSLVLDILNDLYPHEDKCYLNYTEPYELLIATILSAQCTDDRVNIVTKDLFKKYTSLEDFAHANIYELEQDIKSTGFYHNKAKHIQSAAFKLIDEFGSVMPSDINELTSLAGVGRKTANVVRGHIFSIPSIVVDTHVKRVSYRLGLTKNTVPEKVEIDLMKILPKDRWIAYNTQIIAHGRAICKSRNPKCLSCAFQSVCMNTTNTL